MESFTIRFLPVEKCVQTLYKRVSEKIWHSIFAELPGDADFEKVFIDSSIVRVHQHAAGSPKKNDDQSIGCSRGGLTTKIHALLDGLGLFARFSLTGGQASDTGEVLPLLSKLKLLGLATEKTYDTNAILQHLKSLGIQAVIFSKENRLEQCILDKYLYVARNLIERFFCCIKQLRRRGQTLREALGTFCIICFSHSCIHLGVLIIKRS